MAMVFQSSSISKIQALLAGSANYITVDGITSSNTLTPSNAKSQLDKFLGIVGKSVVTANMKQIVTREAVEGE